MVAVLPKQHTELKLCLSTLYKVKAYTDWADRQPLWEGGCWIRKDRVFPKKDLDEIMSKIRQCVTIVQI